MQVPQNSLVKRENWKKFYKVQKLWVKNFWFKVCGLKIWPRPPLEVESDHVLTVITEFQYLPQIK